MPDLLSTANFHIEENLVNGIAIVTCGLFSMVKFLQDVSKTLKNRRLFIWLRRANYVRDNIHLVFLLKTKTERIERILLLLSLFN